MSQVPPRLQRMVPPDSVALAESQQRGEELRAALEEERRRLLPLRRAVLLAGPALSDLEAALSCVCACHPGVGDPGLHEHGVRCSCQLSQEERAAALESLFSLREGLGPDPFGFGAFQDEVARRAAELGVELQVVCPAAPLVVSGTVDGRGCFLRERHGSFSVEVSPDEDPGRDVWTAPPTEPSYLVAEGSEVELEPLNGESAGKQVVDVLVDAVRTFLRQRECAHPGQVVFCPLCGAKAA